MADDVDFTPAPEYEQDDPGKDSVLPQGEQRKSGKAIASLVCGIISLFVVGVILGIVAVVLGVIARNEIKADPALGGDGLALGGIITGAIGAALAIVLIAAGVTLI